MPSSAFVPSTPLQGAMAAKANRPHSSLRASVDASQSILSHNLTQMDSSMMRVLEVESWGGNAGTVVLAGENIHALRLVATQILNREEFSPLETPRMFPRIGGRVIQNLYFA